MTKRILIVVGLVVGYSQAAAAQEPARASAAEPTWVEALTASVEAGEGVTLTAVQTAELFEAVVALENARVADVAISGGRVYVISVDRRVIATADLPPALPRPGQ